jgi:hypothetical protein
MATISGEWLIDYEQEMDSQDWFNGQVALSNVGRGLIDQHKVNKGGNKM